MSTPHVRGPEAMVLHDDDTELRPNARSSLAQQPWDGNSHHPAKRQRILACKRCRHRKQKCDGDGENPCSNCSKANEECEPTEPTLTRTRYKADYVQSLEQRLGQLERLIPQDTLSRLENSSPEPAVSGNVDTEGSHGPFANLPTDAPNQNIHAASCFPRPTNLEASSIHSGSFSQGHEAFQPTNGSPTTLQLHAGGASPAQTHHSLSSQASAHRHAHSPTIAPVSSKSLSQLLSRSESSINSMISTLPCTGGSNQSRSETGNFQRRASFEHYLNQLAIWPDTIPSTVEEHLINVYFDITNKVWPFLLKHTFYSWYITWKRRPHERQCSDLWQGFFVNMIFAISLLLEPKNPLSVLETSQNFYDQAVHHLSSVLRHPSPILHVQAYLMMAIRALHWPSTEQIALMISSAVRHCVVARFHLAETEPEPKDNATRLEIQMRRRVFWAAYALDRFSCGVLRLPFSIADDTITVPLYDEIDDSLLSEDSSCPNSPLVYTSISPALHRVKCWLIQSEILNMTMRSDFATNFDSLLAWRSYILSKLDNWKSQIPLASEFNSNRNTDERWILIVYNNCLLFLHIPTKSNVRGPAGDWSLRASFQTIKTFRKFQGYKTIATPWLSLISQFSIGITILYCLWATPPKFRTDAYDSKNVLETVRACSNNLTLLTERWECSRDLLEVFELLATEVPPVENISPSHDGHHGRAIKRISSDAIGEIHAKMPNIKSMVLNGETIRMIEEMITEDFPCEGDGNINAETFGHSEGKTDTVSVTNNLPIYQFLSPYMSGDHLASQIGALPGAQSLEFPGCLPGYDIF